jgi:hypothetical protein
LGIRGAAASISIRESEARVSLGDWLARKKRRGYELRAAAETYNV